MRFAAGRRWLVEYRFKASAAIGRRTDSNVIGSAFRTHLARLSSNAVRLSDISLNPRANVAEQGFLGTSQSVLRASFVIESATPIESSIVDMAFAEAVKAAGNPGFSATRIAESVPDAGGCGSIDRLAIFHSGESVYEVCRTQSPLIPSADTVPAPAVSASDAMLASAGTSSVHSSTVAAEVGSKDEGLATRLPQLGLSAWDTIPLSAKIGGVVVGSAIVLALFGYAFRSVK